MNMGEGKRRRKDKTNDGRKKGMYMTCREGIKGR